eukprot:CAMPEP_0119038428 /NCGR_PEP_ID=MMETSP1177-20130426/7369_1 /TAXON_ID=2985 /ORGANISM="Ochromonas sp, Strain CCMP1899" /LENGTH=400 /DNA_ID=CAMNT_0007001023 /DNA_START=526 /DNA_END=1728 /DNA_ORIENTATION=-
MCKEKSSGVKNPYFIPRECMVTVAGLGTAGGPQETIKRVKDACENTGLEYIDFAIVECDEATFTGPQFEVLNETIDTLEQMCEQGVLQSYGLNVNVPPYNYHTPAIRTTGNLSMIPTFLESSMLEGKMPFNDLMIYPISPSNAMPHTYPMLDSDPEIYDYKAEGEESDEDNREFTRAACDPFLCFRGGDQDDIADSKTDEEIIEAIDGGSEDRAPSSNKNKIYLDPLDDPSVLQAIRDMNDEPPEPEEEEDNSIIDAEIIEPMPNIDTAKGKPLNEYFDKTNKKQKEIDDKELAELELIRLTDLSKKPDLILISGFLPDEVENEIANALDMDCEVLKSTPRLQDKAIRVAFSVGCEVLIIDAESSAKMGKLTLSSEDLVTADDTEELFTNFGLQVRDVEK